MPDRTILIIDSDATSTNDAKTCLLDAGYTVEVCRDGESGLEAFREIQPDVVLLEVMLPKKHGFEVCQEIKYGPHGDDTTVLVTSAENRDKNFMQEALRIYGYDRFLEKPIDHQELLDLCRVCVSEDENAGADALARTVEDEIVEHLDTTLSVVRPEGSAEALAAQVEIFPGAARRKGWGTPIAWAAVIAASLGFAVFLYLRGPGDEADPTVAGVTGTDPIPGAYVERVVVTAETGELPGPLQTPGENLPAASVATGEGAATGTPVVATAEPARETATVAPKTVPPPVPRNESSGAETDPAPVVSRSAPAEPEPEPVKKTLVEPPVVDTTSVAAGTVASNETASTTAPASARDTVGESLLAANLSNSPAATRDAAPSGPGASETPVAPGTLPGTDADPVEAAAILHREADPIPPRLELPIEPEPVLPAVPRASPGDLVELADVDRAPVGLDKPAPKYNPIAHQLKQEGRVSLRLLIDESGRVAEVELIRGIDGSMLNKDAIRAVKRWTFLPARKDGVPVKVWTDVAVDFKLSGP